MAQATLEVGANANTGHGLDLGRVLHALELAELVGSHDEALTQGTARGECSAHGLLHGFADVSHRSHDPELLGLLDGDGGAAAQCLGVGVLGRAKTDQQDALSASANGIAKARCAERTVKVFLGSGTKLDTFRQAAEAALGCEDDEQVSARELSRAILWGKFHWGEMRVGLQRAGCGAQ